MTAPTPRNPSHLLVLVLASLVLLFFSIQLLDRDTQIVLSKEHGVIEMVSVISYFVCIFVMLATGGIQFFVRHWYMPLVVLLMALRELDFDKRFTTMGILKSGFYRSSDVPVVEKLVGLLVVVVAACAVGMLIKNHLPAFIARLRGLRPEALALALAILFVAISKSIDGLARKLASVGIAVGEQTAIHAELIEEVLELGIPIMLIISTWTCLSISTWTCLRPRQARQ